MRCRKADRAPWIRNLRRYLLPRLLSPSSFGLPPVVCRSGYFANSTVSSWTESSRRSTKPRIRGPYAGGYLYEVKSAIDEGASSS